MKQITIAAALALAACTVAAKLPPASADAKDKAAEAAARAGWNEKVALYQLCKAQDRIAADYRQRTAKAAASAQTNTPPCTDPGPFSYAPAEQKPLEAAGAHSPPATAATPPNTATPSAQTKDGSKKP